MKVTLLILTLLTLSACNFREDKSEAVDASTLSVSTISYQHVADGVLTPRCTGCHGTKGGVNLETFDQVVAAIQGIYETSIVSQSMPPSSPLSQNQKQLLSLWLEAGAPLEAGGQARVTPIAPGSGAPIRETPLPEDPSFADIEARILRPSCSECHDRGGEAAEDPLDYASLLESELVVPWSIDESRIFRVLTRIDRKQMPPSRNGYGPLSAAKIQMLKNWIARGARY